VYCAPSDVQAAAIHTRRERIVWRWVTAVVGDRSRTDNCPLCRLGHRSQWVTRIRDDGRLNLLATNCVDDRLTIQLPAADHTDLRVIAEVERIRAAHCESCASDGFDNDAAIGRDRGITRDEERLLRCGIESIEACAVNALS